MTQKTFGYPGKLRKIFVRETFMEIQVDVV